MLDCSGLTKEIEKLQKKIKKSDIELGYGSGDCPIHATILSGLETNSAEKIFDSVPLKSIRYKITELDCFSNDKNDVLKFTVESDDLKKLNKIISNKYKNTQNFPSYKPHITVAYLKVGRGEKYKKMKSSLIGLSMIGNVLCFSDTKNNLSFRLLE
jgi:2'-5' RNA ligase